VRLLVLSHSAYWRVKTRSCKAVVNDGVSTQFSDDARDHLASRNDYVRSRDDDVHEYELPHHVHVDEITREYDDEHDLQLDDRD
jgi:hypothetical protein